MGIPRAITASDTLKKTNSITEFQFNVFDTSFVVTSTLRTVPNRYVLMSFFKIRFGTSRYIYIHEVECRTKHEGQEGPGSRFDRNGYEIKPTIQPQGRTTMQPEGRSKEFTAWAASIFEQHSESDLTTKRKWNTIRTATPTISNMRIAKLNR